MKRIAELIVRVADLVEAEGRSLRSITQQEGGKLKDVIARMAMGFVFLAVAVPVMIVGFCLIIGGILVSLHEAVGPALAGIITGVAALAVSAGCIYLFKRSSER